MANAVPLEIVGTWEELAAHASDFEGHRLRVTVLPASVPDSLPESNRKMLEWLEESRTRPLSHDEVAALEDLERVQRQKRVGFYGAEAGE